VLLIMFVLFFLLFMCYHFMVNKVEYILNFSRFTYMDRRP